MRATSSRSIYGEHALCRLNGESPERSSRFALRYLAVLVDHGRGVAGNVR